MTRRDRPEPIRFVSQALHAYMDYPLAVSLIVLPIVLGMMPLATTLSAAAGLMALLLTVLTDHETGVIRVLPYKLHLALDGLGAAAFLALPIVFGLHGLEALYFLVLGVTILLLIAAHRPDPALAVA